MAGANAANKIQLPSYIFPNATTITTTTATATPVNGINEPLSLCDITVTCTQRKKRTKRHLYLTFVESRPLSSSDEQARIEISGRADSSFILLDGALSFEYFDTVKNDFESFIYIYFESYTISIYFSNENLHKKSLIIKHFEYMYQKKQENAAETNNKQVPQEISSMSTTDFILHTFDAELIPCEPVIPRHHVLIGRVRLYFTTTDLYITSIHCKQESLKRTIKNQCPSKDEPILCIPYFTIKHYGNRSNIFLIEIGRSDYGNGEIHMRCISSSLAGTIHLLVSPVIEERPLILSSAFQNQLLANKRIEKSKNIQPPIQLSHDSTNCDVDSRLPSISKRHSFECLTENSNKIKDRKSHSLFGWFRRLSKTGSHLSRSHTLHSYQNRLKAQSTTLSQSNNKFFELNIEEKLSTSNNKERINILKSQDSDGLRKTVDNEDIEQKDASNGTYIDMGSTIEKSEQNQQEADDEKLVKGTTSTTVEIGVNTTISLLPHIHSAIIIGTAAHTIAEERSVFPIGQRSFTSPACIMQPFKTQLYGQTTANHYATTMASNSPFNSSSTNRPTSASDSHQSLLLSYGIVTLNKIQMTSDQIDCVSASLSMGSNIDRRLYSDASLMSAGHQQVTSNVHPCDSVLSASSGSHIFRTLSLTTSNAGDNASGQVCTPLGSIILLDESLSDQTTNYLIASPPLPLIDDRIQTNLSPITSLNLTSMSPSHLPNINEEKPLSSDPYAFVEPLPQTDASQSDLPSSSAKPSITSDKSVHYIDLLVPSSNSNNDEQHELTSVHQNAVDTYNDFMDEKTERTATVIYTDIDFNQIERRDRIVQLAALSNSEDKVPPFVL